MNSGLTIRGGRLSSLAWCTNFDVETSPRLFALKAEWLRHMAEELPAATVSLAATCLADTEWCENARMTRARAHTHSVAGGNLPGGHGVVRVCVSLARMHARTHARAHAHAYAWTRAHTHGVAGGRVPVGHGVLRARAHTHTRDGGAHTYTHVRTRLTHNMCLRTGWRI